MIIINIWLSWKKGLTTVHIVVQRAVRGAHQVDQTGLAEGDCVALCKRTQSRGELSGWKSRILPATYFNTAAEVACQPAVLQHKLTYLSMDPLQLSNQEKIENGLKCHSCFIHTGQTLEDLRHTPFISPCSTIKLTSAQGLMLPLIATDQMPHWWLHADNKERWGGGAAARRTWSLFLTVNIVMQSRL